MSSRLVAVVLSDDTKVQVSSENTRHKLPDGERNA